MGKLCDPVETYAAPTHVYSRADFDRSALNRKGVREVPKIVRTLGHCASLEWGRIADLHRNSPLDP